MYCCLILKLRKTSLRNLIDNDNIEITNDVKKQVLEELLPIATKGSNLYVNGDMKDRVKYKSKFQFRNNQKISFQLKMRF